MGWTRKSYDAVHDWIDANKRDKIRKILHADGLDKELARLDAAKNLGEWYAITREAVKAVGVRAVSASARMAQAELSLHARTLGRRGGQSKSKAKAQASRDNGKRGGRPRKGGKNT